MNVDVIDKANSATVSVATDNVIINHPSIVRIDVQRSQIAGLDRQGSDLIVRLTNGETVRIANFYREQAGLHNDLVLREPDQSLWLASASSGAGRFTALHAVEDLAVVAGGHGGGGSLLPILLGVGAAGGAAAALGGGGGGGGATGTNPTPTADTTAPGAPTVIFSAAGTGVSGAGEAGATVQVRDADGTVIGTGTVGSNGNYTVVLTDPQANGETVTVTQMDPAGNVSAPTTATGPDITAPDAPTATVVPDGSMITGTGEPGATVTVQGTDGTPMGTGVVDPDGTYEIPLPPGMADGEPVEVTQTDPMGNTSAPTMAMTPDLAAPPAPTAIVSADGATVTGTGEPGATVTVTGAGNIPLGTAVVAADGSYVAPLTPVQANGETIQVVQADTDGNASAPVTVTAPDITAPAAPDAAVSADGTVVTGTGETGATVTVRSPAGIVIGTAVVGATGAYSVTLTTTQIDGQRVQVTQADAAGNASPATVAVAPDFIAPAAPTGAASPDGTIVSGTGEPGATVTIRDPSGSPIGSAIVAANGSYSATLTTPQANGGTLEVRQADPAGNVSPPTAVVTPDITAPLGLTAAVNGAGTVVSGVGEVGATVTVRDPLGATIGTGTVAANGSYTVALTTAQANGQLLQVTQADAAGNPSTPVPALAPDITAPAAPVAAVSLDGTTVTGNGEPGATVTVRDPAGTAIGTTTVAGDGSYSVILGTPQTNGEVLTVRQADPAGNASPQVSATAPDITAPVGLTASVSGDGTVVTGMGEAGATVTVRDPLGTAIGTAIVASNGGYAVVLTTPQANGELLRVTQADAAGNPSVPVPALAPDITAPTAPVFAVSPDGATVTGSAEPGATLTITGPAGAVIGSGPVAGDGSFSIILTTPQANGGTLSATQADAAGNVSAAGTAPAPDITPPALPAATLDATGSTVTGTGEAGATVTVRDPFATVIGTGTVDTTGHFSIALSTPQIDSQVLSVVQSDAAGNPSPALALNAPDLTAPAVPVGTVAPDGASITGSGEAGATLVITDPVGLPIGTVIVANDGTFTTALVPPQINGEVLGLTQTDVAGNASAPGSTVAPDLVPNDSPDAPTATVAADGATVFGTGDAGATVTVTAANGTVLGTATVAPGGSYTVILATPQLNGETVRVVQADAEGDLSPPTTAIAPDLTPPAAPAATIDATGTIVTGTGEAGANVRVANAGGTVLGTAIVGANGSYAVVLTTPQTNGQALTVIQADAATNDSPATPVTAPDTTAPLAPTAVVSTDGATVTGSGEAGATVTITGPGGVPLATAIVTPGGTYTATLSTPQLNGERLAAVQTDPAGNASPAVTATAPDTTAPIAPSATVGLSGLIVTGAGEPGATVLIRNPAGTQIATAVVAADGSYTATLPVAQLNGEQLQVAQADAAGNVSPPTVAQAPDVTAPIVPTGSVSADGTAVTGVGEAGATVHISDAANAVIGTAVVAGDGSYTAVLTAPQANGQTLTLNQTDPAGNTSPSPTIGAPDITPPAAPAAVTISGDGSVVTGTGEPGATAVVRDAGGAVIGTATVAVNGSFAVALADPQTAGEALNVTLRDPAGNQSGAVPITAPFDIAAFDNAATASIDLVPTMTNENLGNANYLALVSLGLLNLDAQVLATPTVQFTVAAGHTLDATFTYDAVLSLGVLSGYSVTVQRFDGTNWTAVSGPGNSSLLQLGLLDGNLVATETLGPGQYRAFVTFDGALGVGLLGGLNVTGVDSDFTHVAAVAPATTSGNVISDAGPGGAVDIVSPQTAVQSVMVNGVTTTVAADDTVVRGSWGTLTIDRDGSYSYTPDANAAAIGHTDVFSYTLRDASDGELETATLTITVGSPDITAAPVAVNDTATATATFENVVTVSPAVVDSSFATPTAILLTGAKTGTVTDSFTVEPNSRAEVTLSAIQQSGLSVLPSYTITVTNAQGAVVGTITQTAIAGLGLGTGTALTLHDLPSGTYTYTVSSTNLLGTGYGTSVYVGQTVTHLDQHHLVGSATTEGNLLANDAPGTDFPTVRVQFGGSFVDVGPTPVVITGEHGTLTVDQTGHYTYQPAASLAYSSADPVDSFAYQVVQPNGDVSTAHLNVAVDINNGAAPVIAAFAGPEQTSALVDAVPLAMLTAAPEAHVATDQVQSAPSYSIALTGDATLDQDLSHFLSTQASSTITSNSEGNNAEISAKTDLYLPIDHEDSLAYLVSMSDLDHNHTAVMHVV